jgi:hypothetical protein
MSGAERAMAEVLGNIWPEDHDDHECSTCMHDMAIEAPQVITALRAAGFAVVPVVATEGMLRAGNRAVKNLEGLRSLHGMLSVWAAMLAAAQEDGR